LQKIKAYFINLSLHQAGTFGNARRWQAADVKSLLEKG
jgi:hypothetical protein